MMNELLSVRPRMKAKRCHLDGAAIEQALRPFGFEQVVEGVVERAQVGVDLGHQVTGQEAEPLARLDGGAGQDDARDLPGLQGVHRLRHGQVRLAGPGRADAERDDVLRNGVDVALLAGRVGTHRLAAGGPDHLGAQHLAGADVLAHHVDRARQGGRVQGPAGLHHDDELVEEPYHHLGLGTLDGDAVALHHDLLVGEGLLDLAQVLVPGPEQAGHQVVAGDEDLGAEGRGHEAVM